MLITNNRFAQVGLLCANMFSQKWQTLPFTGSEYLIIKKFKVWKFCVRKGKVKGKKEGKNLKDET